MPITVTMWCPRCDRSYIAATVSDALKKVKDHVAEQHPDHDPEWFETYPESYGN